MAVSFNVFSGHTLDTTSPGTLSHAGGSAPKGVLAFAFKDNASGPVTAVSYGGVAMTQVSGSPNGKAAAETMEVSVWFLGSGIPTGTQNVVFTYGAAGIFMGCLSVNGAANTELVDVDATINSNSIANPSVTLNLGGRTCFCSIHFSGGGAAVTDITPLSGWTSRAETDDGQLQYGSYTYNTIGTADVTAGWTQVADDAVAIAVAISEVSSGPQTLTATAATVNVSAPAATVVPGAIALTATAAAVNVSAPTATLRATLSLVATAATVNVSAPTATLAAGVPALAATAAQVSVSAPTATLVPGIATITATAAIVTVTAPTPVVLPIVRVIATAALVNVSAPTPVTIAVVRLTATAALVTVTAPTSTLVVGPVIVVATAALVTVTAPSATISAGGGAATLTATAALVTVTAPTATIAPVVRIIGTAAQVTVTAPSATITGGGTTIGATAALVNVSAGAAVIPVVGAALHPDLIGLLGVS